MQVVVEMIDHGFQCIVSADELLDASEFELPLTYILPRVSHCLLYVFR